jgi:hypothetical protein
MSKNTSNRTFYYKDSNLGEHTITITFKGRDSQKSFSANQKINISSTVSETPNSSNNSSSQNEQSSSGSGTIKDFDFDVSVGKDKFSSVNNDVVFQAVAKNLKDIQAQNIQYLWTLGDGSRKEGQIINYKYKYPGEYTVVLNASFSDKYSSARLKVTVIEPVFEINIIPGAIELINKSDGEINLGDWVVVSGYQKFIVPKDTIVGKGKKIIFDRGIINISGQEIHLKDPSEKEIAFANASSTKVSSTQFTVLNQEVDSLTLNKNKVTKETVQVKKDIVFPAKNKVKEVKLIENQDVQKTEKEEVLLKEVLNGSTTSDTMDKNNVATVYLGKSKTSKLDFIVNIPIKGFKWLVHFFR